MVYILSMPALASEVARVVHESISIVLPVCFGGDDGDFVVELAVLVDSEFSTGVVHSMTMELSQVSTSLGRELHDQPWM